MFNRFFKSKAKILPTFSSIGEYVNKDKFFVRTKPWDWLDKKQIYVASILNGKPTMITMEFWPQEIFLDAEGQITVSELLELASKQYIDSNMDVPKNLDVVLIDSLNSLANELEIIEFVDSKITLEYKLAVPMSKQLETN
jgi:hypothetical protein